MYIFRDHKRSSSSYRVMSTEYLCSFWFERLIRRCPIVSEGVHIKVYKCASEASARLSSHVAEAVCTLRPVYCTQSSFRPSPILSTIAIYHVSDPNYTSNVDFFTLPSHLRSSAEVLPKADQEGPSRTPTCDPVSILRFYRRHPRHPSGSSSGIRQISQWR